jgi:hypothetical protein
MPSSVRWRADDCSDINPDASTSHTRSTMSVLCSSLAVSLGLRPICSGFVADGAGTLSQQLLRAAQRRPPCVGLQLTVPGPIFHPHLPFSVRSAATGLGCRSTTFRIEPFKTLKPPFRRSFTLSSLFSPRAKPTPTPSPSTVADISLLEAAANINHNDVDKQIALYEALLATKVKAGYDTIISRWERLSEFVCHVQPSSTANKSSECWE